MYQIGREESSDLRMLGPRIADWLSAFHKTKKRVANPRYSLIADLRFPLYDLRQNLFKDEIDMANARTAVVGWTGQGLEMEGVLGSGYALKLNGKASAETGGSPMELLLAGVAGCTAIDMVLTLQKMRQQITDVRVEMSGVRAEEHPRVYVSAEITYHITGHDISERAVKRAIKLSKEKYCSASVMFERSGTVMKTNYTITEVENDET